MRCSVVFGVTLRLLVINISSSSPAMNIAAYYQRCVITCERVAVHRRPRLQHLPVAALTQAVNQNRDFCLPHLHSTPPLGGGWFPSEHCYAVWRVKTRTAWLHDGEKILMICLFILTRSRTWQTHRQTNTAWRHRPRLQSIAWQKNKLSRPLVIFRIQNSSTPSQHPGLILSAVKVCLWFLLVQGTRLK